MKASLVMEHSDEFRWVIDHTEAFCSSDCHRENTDRYTKQRGMYKGG